MKKAFKFSYMVILSLMAFAISSCTSDYDYTGAPKVANEVFFSNTQESKFELSKSSSSFVVTLNRVKTEGELTVPLIYTPDEGSIFQVPASVTFADGEASANITITYNPDELQYGTYSGGTISVGGEDFDTTYGIGSFTFSAGATEWVDFTTNKSMGLYREDVLTTFYGVPNTVEEVKIQKSVVEDGKYRIVNPYASWDGKDGVTYDSENDHYWVINATDPDYVYVETCHTGLNLGGGEIKASSQVAFNLEGNVPLEIIKEKKPEWFGTLKNGVITMPQKTLLISEANYNDGAFYLSNKNGLFAVALPGYAIADYNVDAAYKGRFTDAKDNDFAQFTITKSEDVAKVKYALVSANSDVNAVVSGIVEGNVEAEEITASGDVNVAFDESGKYTLVMIMYNANDEAVGVNTLTVPLRSSKEGAEVWNTVAAGTVTIGAKSLGSLVFDADPGVLMGDPLVVEGELTQSESDPTKFRLTPFAAGENTSLEFTVDEDGNITVEMQETGLVNQDKTPIMVVDGVTFATPQSELGQFLISKGLVSNYDSSKKLYTFYHFYVNPQGGPYAFEQDTFEVTSEGEAKALGNAFAKAKAAAHRLNKIPAKTQKLFMAERVARAL